MVTLLALSLAAGVLTVAAPCVLPLLPIIVGGSIVRGGASDGRSQWLHPVTIAMSLAWSVLVFTVLLKASTALLGIPGSVWQGISGAIVIAFGVTLIFPQVWEKMMALTGLQNRSNEALSRAHRSGSVWGDIALGAALGPVFSSCSPTYALILATILPVSFAEGVLYITVYAFGLAATLLVVSFLGQTIISRLGWLANPDGVFRRVVGALFVTVGLAVVFGLDKLAQAFILAQGWYDPIVAIEEWLRPAE